MYTQHLFVNDLHTNKKEWSMHLLYITTQDRGDRLRVDRSESKDRRLKNYRKLHTTQQTEFVKWIDGST